MWKGSVDAEADAGSTSPHQQPPHPWKGEGDEAKTDGVSSMSEWARRKRAKLIQTALIPETSLARFQESFSRSAASDALKARFARLANHGTGLLNPNLPASSNEAG